METPFSRPGRFWRGNLHTHSTLSDGHRSPEEVCRFYETAGYDFLALTEHFLEQYGWPLVDTRPFRSETFTTIIGAELHPAQDRMELGSALAHPRRRTAARFRSLAAGGDGSGAGAPRARSRGLCRRRPPPVVHHDRP